MARVLVVGGGAAGLMAAIWAARSGAETTLWEKNDRLGKKLAITGKGRCNLTNACSIDETIKNLTGNGRFMYSALNAFSNDDVYAFFEELGVPLKVERGQRVFPQSDHAADVVKALTAELLSRQVMVRYGYRAQQILQAEDKLIAVCNHGRFEFDSIILATGGCTYKGTGSTGDGYALAKALGHTVTPILPSLVPLVAAESWIPELAGLSLKNAQLTLFDDRGKKLGGGFGEMLFTHFGLSGPVVLTLSDTAARFWLKKPQTELQLRIDLKPALSEDQLDTRIMRDFEKYIRKQFANSLGDLLPKSLIPIVIMLSGIEPETPVNQITREERRRLTAILKALPVTLTGTRPLDEGIVTAGGVKIKEIDPKTFESKLVKGLFIIGELLDIHGFTGGYNLQAAFSSGYCAGIAAARASDFQEV